MFSVARPRISLGCFPTPLQLAPRLSASLGHDSIFMKRDDLSGLGLGGNKTRSLEFLLGEAVSANADVVITAGGLQSNLCALTAAACCKAGLRCILVHNDVPPQKREGNMLLNALFGADQKFIGKVDEAARAAFMDSLAQDLRKQNHRPYVIHNGASTAVGSLGYLEAAREIYLQSRERGLNIKHIVMVGAMGGTCSGFVFGAALLGAPFHVHVISVEYETRELTRRIQELCRGIANLTDLEPSIPLSQVMTVYDAYLGGGYGVPTRESAKALLDAARLEGIVLENVYTSKTLSGLAGLVETGRIPKSETCCYVHTGGAGSFFAQAPLF